VIPSEPPALKYSKMENALRLQWKAPGFILQETLDLSDSSGWRDVPGGSFGDLTVEPDPGAGQKFYRLRRK
jgi:hypothetical protein